jgi:predicted PurR-regulated permease PerM
MIDKNNIKDFVTYALILILFIVAGFIIWPFITAIIYGVLLAYIFFPIYNLLLHKVKNEFIAALIVCLGVLIILLVVALLLLGAAFRQAIDFYLFLQKLDIISLIRQIIPQFITSSGISENIISSINTSISSLIAAALRKVTEIISNIYIIILNLVIVIFTFFFGLKDGKIFLEYLKSLSPFKKEVEEKLFNQLKEITNSVLVGQIIVGIIQGLIAGIGYFIFGVPNALLLTVLTIIFSMIPFIGAWLIWIPTDIYLFATGNSTRAFGLLIYGLFVISWIDNLARMLIIAKKTKINTAVLMIGMLGGLFAFGFLGLIIGPLILAYILLIIEIYRKGNFGEDLIFKKIE